MWRYSALAMQRISVHVLHQLQKFAKSKRGKGRQKQIESAHTSQLTTAPARCSVSRQRCPEARSTLLRQLMCADTEKRSRFSVDGPSFFAHAASILRGPAIASRTGTADGANSAECGAKLIFLSRSKPPHRSSDRDIVCTLHVCRMASSAFFSVLLNRRTS